MFVTSLVMGSKIRTMWMTPFYLFLGVLVVYLFQKKIDLKKINSFFVVFLILFIISLSLNIELILLTIFMTIFLLWMP